MAVWNLPRPAAAVVLSTRRKRKAILAQVLIAALGLLLQGEAAAAVTLNCSNPNAESLLKALEMSVFQRKAIRPVVSLQSPTQVNVSFTLYAILGVDEKIQTMTTFIWQVLEWNMEIVQWDPVQCGTHNISIPSENIWVPDILINEFMDEDRSPKTPYLYLKHNGNVYYDIPVRVVSSCTMDIFNFPFDVQNCSLSFGSYLHTANDVRVSMGMTAEKTFQAAKALMKTKGEWELVNIEARGNFLNTTDFEYDEVVYQLIIRRRPKLYVMNLIIPSAFLMMIDLFSFLLPAQNVDRASFKMTLILGYTVFLLIMNDLLPSSAETPLISSYFAISLSLMVASVLETVAITNILYSSRQYPEVPPWVRKLVLHYMARVVCYSPRLTHWPNTSKKTVTLNPAFQGAVHEIKDPKEAGPQVKQAVLQLQKLSGDLQCIRQYLDSHFHKGENEEVWVEIGHILDRFLFGLYLFFLTVSAIIFIIIWATWHTATTD
ncbi:5-hydroxytryptamine receptor 3C-like [Acipenser ruthenus]|uniref:5-hydroxytryptamine receptor 3C-like n=1 Tax=Acipenser ruthenus TaxID=7906 RepID=UPI002740BD24|nr:5-hydroxytryptamine receptor 3C-like [Acipenser ruthenus]